jgi:hypothetical protein
MFADLVVEFALRSFNSALAVCPVIGMRAWHRHNQRHVQHCSDG